MTTTELVTDCGKCGGLRILERIGIEIDAVCLNCGLRQEAVAKLPVYRSAIVDRVEDPDAKVHLERQVVCPGCGDTFTAWTRNRMYCSRACADLAHNERRRAL